ncbi:MAG: hypothetical protein C5B57_11495 [Blastocatellia bacterium]|nr:MAG: hypothetical protein C5B57_11495 [Blastocatellia bacterium]
MTVEPEVRHRACWYSRRTADIPPTLGVVETIEDGQLLYCAHPMWFPIVGYRFDVRNCSICDFFKPVRSSAALTIGGR